MSNEPSHTLADTSAVPSSLEKSSVSEQHNGSGTSPSHSIALRYNLYIPIFNWNLLLTVSVKQVYSLTLPLAPTLLSHPRGLPHEDLRQQKIC